MRDFRRTHGVDEDMIVGAGYVAAVGVSGAALIVGAMLPVAATVALMVALVATGAGMAAAHRLAWIDGTCETRGGRVAAFIFGTAVLAMPMAILSLIVYAA